MLDKPALTEAGKPASSLGTDTPAQTETGALELINDQLSRDSKPGKSTERRINLRVRYFRPIILIIPLLLFLPLLLSGQITGYATLGTDYSDNVFQLSSYDLTRFDHDASVLDYIDTTDDIALASKAVVGYDLHYRWWRFTPNLGAMLSQNLSNTDKRRYDLFGGVDIHRYYGDLNLKYTYSPYIYYRHFTDSDGTDNLEAYSYGRNQLDAAATVRPHKHLSVKGSYTLQNYYYNEYFTEADGMANVIGVSAAYRFPIFTLDGGYSYRTFNNDTPTGGNDSSYDSNIYQGKLTLNRMPLSENSKTTWRPFFGLNYEQRFFQGQGTLYNGRADYIYRMNTGFAFRFDSQWNLSVDYTHIFRNVESASSEVLRLKEFSENQLGAELRYSF